MRAYQRLLQGLALVLPFPQPSKLIGAGALRSLPPQMRGHRWQRPLLVTNQQLLQLQLPQPLLQELKRSGRTCRLFDQVPDNPSLACVEAGLRAYHEGQCDSLVAVGGGSVIDCAKAIGARAANPWLSCRAMEGLFRVVLPPPPLACVPTTAGSGSEASIAAVLTDGQRQRKLAIADLKLLPEITVIDPELMLGLPPAITAAGGLDALTHAVEAYIGRGGTPFSNRRALDATAAISRWLPRAYSHGSDIEARLQMALAAHAAGEAFTRTNVGYAHALAHALGCAYGIPHGLANALVLPSVLRFSLPACEPRLAALARAAGLGTSQDSDQRLARDFINWVVALNQQLGVPPLIAPLRSIDIPRISADALREAHPSYPVPRLMGRSDCEALLTQLLPDAASPSGAWFRSTSPPTAGSPQEESSPRGKRRRHGH